MSAKIGRPLRSRQAAGGASRRIGPRLSGGSVLLAALALFTNAFIPAVAAPTDSRGARAAQAPPYVVPAREFEPKNVPDFAADASATKALRASGGTALKAGLESATLPVETRLKLVVEYPLDAKTSQPGDTFEGHVRDDLFLGRSLILPRGSLVRGRVIEVTRPRLISRAARVGLRLEQIVTPSGEVIPLDAALEFHKGVSNQRGELDPGTSFASRVGDDLKAVTGLNATGGTRSALMAANIATLGAPAAATLIGSSAIALFRSGDNISVQPGQEIDILLTNDLGMSIE